MNRRPPRAEIVATGSELLTGGLAETNSIFLADRLLALGFDPRFKTVVGDDDKDLFAALSIAARRVRLVVVSGGLGATEDDRTREAAARFSRRRLRVDGACLGRLLSRYRRRGILPPPRFERLAAAPVGSAILSNPAGSAVGFRMKCGGSDLVFLPGVPAELSAIWFAHVEPWIRTRLGAGVPVEVRVARTIGLSEGELERRIAGLYAFDPAATIGLRVLSQGGGVDVRVTLRGLTRRRAQALWTRLRGPLKRQLGEAIYSFSNVPLETVVARGFMARGVRLALAESCTGGLLGHRLTNVPGSSAFLDSVVTYSNRSKIRRLGVSAKTLRRHGAVSPQAAAEMARGARRLAKASVGLAITGIAGPGGGSAKKPVGLVEFALATSRKTEVATRRFRGNREGIKWQATQFGLDLLRRWLS